MRRKNCNQVQDRLFKSGQFTSIVVFLLCFSFCSCLRSEPRYIPCPPSPPVTPTCTRLLPGLRNLRRGVDCTTLDMLPLTYSGHDGIKHPVIDFKCTQGKTRYIGNTRYNVPDEVSSIINVPGGFLDIDVNILKTSYDLVETMNANLGIDSEIKGLFSASASYKEITTMLYNDSRYAEQIISHQSSSRADLIPKFALKLGKFAQIFVDRRLPGKFEDGPKKYFEFIHTFGTHYLSNVKFGGCFQLYLKTKKAYYRGKHVSEVKAEAGASFYKIVKGVGGATLSEKEVDSDFEESTIHKIRYYGGDTNLLASKGVESWQPTVAKNPWVFGGHLVPLSELIRNPSKKKSLEKATEIYIDLAYLDSLLYILQYASNKYSTSRQQIANYLKQVQALKAAKTIDHNAVLALGNKIEEDLEIPSWFYDKVKLCYKWRTDGDSGQCGYGREGTVCAEVGAMTQYYIDSTGKHEGGCLMQWGIMKPQSMNPRWFEQIQICYRYWPDGDDRQCGCCTKRLLCAPLNKFTQEYKDSTDQRPGGCLMQWNLMVPQSAPIWLQNMKICFQWSPDGDGSQCGKGVNQMLCATANKWTTPYRDDTDKRDGGCRMRWGIIPS